MNESRSSPPRWMASRNSPQVATNWWIETPAAFETFLPSAPVVETRPHATDRKTIR